MIFHFMSNEQLLKYFRETFNHTVNKYNFTLVYFIFLLKLQYFVHSS